VLAKRVLAGLHYPSDGEFWYGNPSRCVSVAWWEGGICVYMGDGSADFPLPGCSQDIQNKTCNGTQISDKQARPSVG
jgi:hypothetical protein